jgi:hypothetical protein
MGERGEPMLINESNYFSKEASMEYCGSSQYKSFMGMRGQVGCEAKALAELRGEWTREMSTALLVGQFVDCYFEGSLDKFKEENPDIFTVKYVQNDTTVGNLASVGGGYVTKNSTLVATKVKEAKETYPEFFTKIEELKAEYRHAETIIQRIERDQTFMNFMSGEKQVIMTAEFAGLKWKIKIDSYLPDVAIVDLKVVKSLQDTFYLKDQGRVNFIEYWGYDYQAAIYQKVVELNTGKRLPFFIAGASKESTPDIQVIQIEQNKLNAAIDMVEASAYRIDQLKKGDVEPVRCNTCDYCRETKILDGPIWSEELILGV